MLGSRKSEHADTDALNTQSRTQLVRHMAVLGQNGGPMDTVQHLVITPRLVRHGIQEWLSETDGAYSITVSTAASKPSPSPSLWDRA